MIAAVILALFLVAAVAVMWDVHRVGEQQLADDAVWCPAVATLIEERDRRTVLVTGLGVELDMGISVVGLDAVSAYVDWVERLPEAVA